MIKTIALFGGSGRTGILFLEKALEKGYRVKALVRDPAKIQQADPGLSIIKGDVLNDEDVRNTIENSDIVVSLFGHVKGSPEWLQTNGTKNIVRAMRDGGPEKIISLSGGGLPFPEKDEPKLADKLIRLIMKVAASKMLNDAIQHAQVLSESQLKWTIVRAPRLTSEPERGTYRVGWVGVNSSTTLGRADLADFILEQIADDTFVHQMPFVSY